MVWRDGDPNVPTQLHAHTLTLTHQPAPFFPAIQTHSHAFTHLLCPPHEELKIDDSTTKEVGRRRGIGEKEEGIQRRDGAHQTRRGGRGGGEKEM